LPRSSASAGKTDSEANEVSGGVSKANVAALRRTERITSFPAGDR
jgi:hypothetical protein